MASYNTTTTTTKTTTLTIAASFVIATLLAVVGVPSGSFLTITIKTNLASAQQPQQQSLKSIIEKNDVYWI